MATPNPTQEIGEEIRSLQSKVGDLQGSVHLTQRRDAVEDLQTTVNALSQRITNLRTHVVMSLKRTWKTRGKAYR